MQNPEKAWYAVYTRPNWEKKATRQMELKGIECYCPLNKVQKQWSDRKKIVLEPLFSNYVFVRVQLASHPLVRKIDGVINFVYWLKKPAVVRDEEIEVIRQFMNDFTNVKLEKCNVNQDDQVRVVGGPLMLREGSVLEVKHKTVKILLPSLGYSLVAEVAKSNIEIISRIESPIPNLVS